MVGVETKGLAINPKEGLIQTPPAFWQAQETVSMGFHIDQQALVYVSQDSHPD